MDFTFTGAANISLTASTEVNDILFNNAQVKAHSNGALALQRSFLVNAPTQAFSSYANGTNVITDNATFAVNSAPLTGTNATTTNAYAILVGSSTASVMFNASTTNTYGLAVFTSGGAQNTYSAIFNGGNVGIGTTSPYAKLSVVGEVVSEYFTATSSAATSTFVGGLAVGRGISAGSYLYGANLSTCIGSNKLIWSGGTFGCDIDMTGGGSGGGTWSTTTAAGIFVNYSNNSTDVVAIGSNSTTTAEYWFDPNTTTAYLQGRVGLGTTSPWRALSVNGSSDLGNNALAGFFTATTSTASIFPYASSTAISVSGTASTTNLTISSALNGLLKTDTSGLVSLATAGVDYETPATVAAAFPFTPTTNFGATANSTSTPIWFVAGLQASSTSHFTNLDYTGTLGFATSSLNASSTIFTFNGRSFIVASTTSGTNGANTALGLDALSNVTSGYQNTAVGYQALKANTIGVQGTAVGYLALAQQTSGNQNTAFGNQALAKLTNNFGNTAVGYMALNTITSNIGTNNNNTALGDSALGRATGGNNIGIGSQALFGFSATNYTGNNSIAIGNSAIVALSTGDNNTVIGNYALTNSRFATSTTIVGAQAGNGSIAANSVGWDTLLGAYSGYNFTTGADYNTLLGFGAGYGITTGANNIVIGSLVDAASPTGSNQLNIGNLLYGTNLYSNTSFATSSAPVLNGSIGIGTSTPWAKLSVHANNGSTNTMLFAIGSSTASATTTLFSVSNTGAVSTVSTLTTGSTITANTGNITALTGSFLLGGNSALSGAGGVMQVGNDSSWTSLSLSPGGSTKVRVLSTGQVGIGSTSPFALSSIHANNGDTNKTLFAIGSSTASATTTLFSVSNTGSTTIANGVNITEGCFAMDDVCIAATSGLTQIGPVGAFQSGPGITLATSSSAFNGLTASTTITADTNTITFTSTLSGLLEDAGVANNLTIDSGTINNTPIGNLTPSTGVFTRATTTNLEVTGTASTSALTVANIASTSALVISGLSGGTSRCLQVNPSGSISSSPTVAGPAAARASGPSSTTRAFGLQQPPTKCSSAVLRPLRPRSPSLRSSQTARLRDTFAEVSSAPSSPTALLTLHARATDTNKLLFAIASSTANATTTLFTIPNTGNVGIGTSTPFQKLCVAGGNIFQTASGDPTCLLNPNNRQHLRDLCVRPLCLCCRQCAGLAHL